MQSLVDQQAKLDCEVGDEEHKGRKRKREESSVIFNKLKGNAMSVNNKLKAHTKTVNSGANTQVFSRIFPWE